MEIQGMNVRLITFSNSNYDTGLAQLKRSLDKFHWDYEIIGGEYIAYGSKQIAYLKYIKENPQYTHIFAIDAFDTFVLSTMEEALEKIEDKDLILLCAEKGCYPYEELSKYYPEEASPWKFVNGGAAFANTEMYRAMLTDYPILHTDNDQGNLTDMYLNYSSKYRIKLDTECKVFQSIAFEDPEDFDYQDNRLINKKANTIPVIIHGNGKTPLFKFYNLVN